MSDLEKQNYHDRYYPGDNESDIKNDNLYLKTEIIALSL